MVVIVVIIVSDCIITQSVAWSVWCCDAMRCDACCRQPIPHALAMLRPLVESRDINTAEGKMILDTQVRQIVRWHCRLSHVAAHTKMLTGKE